MVLKDCTKKPTFTHAGPCPTPPPTHTHIISSEGSNRVEVGEGFHLIEKRQHVMVTECDESLQQVSTQHLGIFHCSGLGSLIK